MESSTCEIKQFPEVEEMDSEKLLEKNGSKVYKIELTCAELEFIRDTLMGVDELTRRVVGSRFFPCAGNMFERGFERIYPEELENKIFQQFYDEDGNYR